MTKDMPHVVFDKESNTSYALKSDMDSQNASLRSTLTDGQFSCMVFIVLGRWLENKTMYWYISRAPWLLMCFGTYLAPVD